MTNAEKMGLLMSLYQCIFTSRAQNLDAQSMVVKNKYFVPSGVAVGRWFSKGLLRGFDVDVQAGDKVLQLRMMEQNFTKTDKAGNLTYYANLAAQGHQIIWVIDRKPGGQFLGRIQNGEWHFAKPQATTPAKSTALPRPVSAIPDIPVNIGIPEYVITVTDNEEDPYELSEYA